MDGDTGHGGIMAVRRMVRECIRAGIAGVRIDDQPIEGKRRTQSAGVIRCADRTGYCALSCRGRHAATSSILISSSWRNAMRAMPRTAISTTRLRRLKAYKEDAGVDWVQLESPHSIDEIKQARAAVKGPFSFMKGKLPHYLSLDEHLALGVNIAWFPGFTHHVLWAALWDFMNDFQSRGIAAWDDFLAAARQTLSGADGRRGWRRRRHATETRTALFRPASDMLIERIEIHVTDLTTRLQRQRSTGAYDTGRRARCLASPCWSRFLPKV